MSKEGQGSEIIDENSTRAGNMGKISIILRMRKINSIII